MVVSRKRKDAKVPKKSHNTPFSILSYAHPHVSPKESLESNILEKELSGLSIIKGSKGKRKAHAKLDSSPSIEDKELNTSLNGSAHTGRGQASFETVDQFNIGLSKTKPNCNSIKGKKDFARTRVNYTSPNYAIIPKERYPIKPEWSFNISKI